MSTEKTKDVIVPLIGTAFAFIASLLSIILVFYTAHRSNQIDHQLQQIQSAQFDAEQAAKTNQFNRESERQYVSLFYKEIISHDANRQKAALSLVKILEPQTGLKLITWARDSGVLLQESREKTLAIEKDLKKLEENSRFLIYLHLGQVKNRNVPAQSNIEKALTSEGFRVVGSDNQKDVYGPGIDYFHDKDKEGAERVAAVLNGLLGLDKKRITVRKQSVTNREGVLGIWF